MPPVTQITEDHVFKACFALMAEGKSPSFNLVYEKLGRKGSAKIIQDTITKWRVQVGKRYAASRSIPSVPDELVRLNDTFLESAYSLAIASVESALANDREAVEQERLQVADSLTEAERKTEEANWRANETSIRLTEAEKELAQLRQAHQELQTNAAATETELTTRLAHAEAETQRVLVESAAIQRGLNDELSRSKQEALADRESHEMDRRRMLVETDRVRQDAQRAVATAEATLAHERSKNTALAAKLESAQTQAAKSQSELHAAIGNIEQLNRMLKAQADQHAAALQVLRRNTLGHQPGALHRPRKTTLKRLKKS